MTNTDFIELSIVDGIKVKFTTKGLHVKRSLCTENDLPIDNTYDTFNIVIRRRFNNGTYSIHYIHVIVYATNTEFKGDSTQVIFDGYISFDTDNGGKGYSHYGANEFAKELLKELIEFWGVDELPPCSYSYSYK